MWTIAFSKNKLRYMDKPHKSGTAVTPQSIHRELTAMCHVHCNCIWIPEHLNPDQAAEFALDHFRRTILNDLDMLVVKTERSETR